MTKHNILRKLRDIMAERDRLELTHPGVRAVRWREMYAAVLKEERVLLLELLTELVDG